MKRILVIAPAFCKPNSPNGQIERHFFSSLPKDDYEVTVLCADRKEYKESVIGCVVKRTPVNKLVNYASRILFHTPFHYIWNVPDNVYYCWGKKAIKEALCLAEKTKYDIIHSISIPCSAHVVALEIKKVLGIPWIAQFYDPWSGNPFRVMKSNKALEKDRYFEQQVANNADMIIHPCDVMVDYWVNLFGDVVKDKLKVLPFVTEIPTFKEHVRDENRLVISHIGNFSSNRNASVFIKAISKLDKDSRNRLVVNFVGSVVESDVQLIKQYGLQDTIKLIGRVSERECHYYYAESDLFLIVDINCSPNLFYPSKILKYFYYKKPILGLTTEQSVISDELRKTGNYAFNYYDVDGIASFLTKAINNYDSILTNDKDYWTFFSKDRVIKSYCRLVDNLCCV